MGWGITKKTRKGYNGSVNKIKRPPKTIKEKKWAKEYVKTGNATEAAARVYDVKNRDSANAVGNENIAKLSFVEILDKAGVTDERLAETLNEAMVANKLHSSPTEPDREVADWQARLKATELATKAKGHLKDDFNVNIKLKPKFVMNDETSKI